MDVRKPALFAALFLVISSCQKNRPVDNVLESKQFSLSEKPCAEQRIENKFLVQWKDGTVEAMTASDYESFKTDFVEPNLDQLKRVEFDRVIHLSQPDTSSTSVAGFSQDWGQKSISADAAWSAGITGQGITVGVVDTWVDPSHPQLKNQFAVNTGEIPDNGIDDDNNGYIDDYYGGAFYTEATPPPGQKNPIPLHGTHVSGIIAADPAAGSIKGLAYNAKIIEAAFLNSQGSGSFSDASRALDYMMARHVKIINASWGGPDCSKIMYDKFQEVANAGILMVVAAGNDHVDIGQVLESPASFNIFNQITVAANTPYDLLTTFSNYSTLLTHLTAPGENIFSTVPVMAYPNGIASMSGTSMAAPFVTGAAALVWSARPQATMQQVRNALLKSVDTSDVLPLVTKGRLNIQRAIAEIKTTIP